jgi:putative transposase
MSQYATAAELAQLPGFPSSERRAREAANRMGLPSRRRVGRGGGQEYSVDSLPPAARLEWAARFSAANDDNAPTASVASLPQTRATSTRQAALVTGWRKEQQDARARVLVQFQRFWQAFGGKVTPALRAFVAQWNAGKLELDQALREQFPILSWTTLRSWYVGVQEKGLAAITPREHARKGQFQALAGEVGNAMLALLMDKPHLSAQAIYEALQTQFQDLPSDRAFRRALAHWKQQNAQVFEAAINPDGWRNKYMSAAGSYSEGITRPNQKWEMDSTVGDLMLADGRRHHIVGVIDVYTRRRIFIVTRTSRANAIMSLIRLAILQWGVPESIKTDNGADYTAQPLETALLGLAVEHPLCAPFSPQEKPHIERGIGTLMHQLFELLDGFIGHSVADRKGIEARKGFAERILKDNSFTAELRMTPEQLQAQIDGYTKRLDTKPRDYLQGRTPLQMTEGHAIKTIDERALDVLLAPSAESGLRKVGKKGIKISGGFYNAAQLGGLEGTQVQVKVDDANLGRCWVFDLDGQFICEALDYERLGINSAEVAAARRQQQAKVIKEQKRELRVAKKSFDTREAIAAINRTRTDQAVEQSTNVVAIQRAASAAQPEHTSPAIESIKQAAVPVVDEAQLEAAQAALAARLAQPAQVRQLVDTPQLRYARWLKLKERTERNEALGADERNWFEGYQQGAEHGSMQRYFDAFGLTADQVLTGSDG